MREARRGALELDVVRFLARALCSAARRLLDGFEHGDDEDLKKTLGEWPGAEICERHGATTSCSLFLHFSSMGNKQGSRAPLLQMGRPAYATEPPRQDQQI